MVQTYEWKEIETFFGGDDEETVNFGKRTEFAASDSLYRIQTLATIRKSLATANSSDDTSISESKRQKIGTDHEAPSLISCRSGESLAVGIGNCLSLFSLNQETFSAALRLDSTIDGLCWLPSSSILVYVSQSTYFGFVDAKSGKLLLRKCLVANSEWRGISFFGCTVSEDNKCTILCLPDSGALVTVTLERYSEWLKALADRDMTSLKQLVGGISVKSHNTNGRIFDHVDLVQNCHLSGLLLSDSVSSSLWLCSSHRDSFSFTEWLDYDSDTGSRCVRSEMFAGGRYMMMLDTHGELTIWDALTLLQVEVLQCSDFDGVVKDFTVLEMSKNSSSLHKNRLLLLRQKEEKTVLEIRNLSDCSLIYSVDVSGSAYLVKPASGQNEEGSVSLLEFVKSGESSEEDCVRLRWITEAHPETRLNRLLSKCLFDEARVFAVQFNLDLQLVYKTQVNYLVGKLHSEVSIESSVFEALFKSLKECIENISDSINVAKLCLGCMDLRRADWIWSLLCLAESRLSEAQEPTSVRESLSIEVLQAKRRLKTYQLVQGPDVELGHSTEWQSYITGRNLVPFLIRLIELGRIEQAEIFWAREETELRKELNRQENSWKLLLESVVLSVTERRSSSSVSIKGLMERNLVHAALWEQPEQNCELVADALVVLCRWLEVGEPEQWPENSLSLAEMPGKVIEAWVKGAVTPAQQAAAACSHCIIRAKSSSFRLEELVRDLTELDRLGKVYNCRLSMDQFLKESKESICYRILDRVQAVELLPVSIEKYARPYMKEKLLHEDETLYRYVLDIAEHASLASSSGGAMGEAPWENRALVVIKAIQSLDVYCQCVLAVAKRAKIPWSHSVTELIDTAMKLNNRTLNVELMNQKRLAGLRNILNKYLIRGQQVKSSLHSRGRFFKLLCSIMNSGATDEMIRDLAEAARLSQILPEEDVYLHHCIHLSQQGMVPAILALLESLPDEARITVGKRVLLRIQVHLNSASEHHGEHAETFIAVYSGVLRDSLSSVDRTEFDKTLGAVRNLRCLERNFKHGVTLKTVQRAAEMKQVPEVVFAADSELFLLKLVSLTDLRVLLKMAGRALDKHNLGATFKCLRLFTKEVRNPHEQEIEDVFKLTCRSLFALSNEDSTPWEFKEQLQSFAALMSWILLKADSFRCLSALKICSFCHLLLHILSQSDPSSKLGGSITVKEQIQGISRYSGVYCAESDGLFIDGQRSAVILKQTLRQIISLVTGCTDATKEADWGPLTELLETHEQRLLLIRSLLLRLSYLGGTPTEVLYLQKQVETTIDRLIGKCSAANQDYCLGLSLFLFLPNKQNFKVLYAIKSRLALSQTRSLVTLVDIGRAVAAISGELDLLAGSEDLSKLSKWAVQLGKYKIAIDTAVIGYRERMEVVGEFASNGVPVNLFWQYCQDFSLDSIEAAGVFLTSAVKNELCIPLASAVLRTMNGAKNEQIEHHLKKILLEDVDPYNYPIIEFLLRELKSFGDRYGSGLDGSGVTISKLISLASFLSAHKRIGIPGKEEKAWYSQRIQLEFTSPSNLLMNDSDFDLCGDGDLLVHGNDLGRIKMPENSRNRLPFHIFLPSCRPGQPDPAVVRVLESEINLLNMTMWQRFAANTSPVKLSENLMLLQAVQNSVLEKGASVELTRETMEEVKGVLMSAKDPQVALKCIGWLAKKLPFGTQRLEMIKCGLEVAQRWLSSTKSQDNDDMQKNATQFLGNFKGVWKKLGTELLLKQYGLLNKGTSALILSPAKLIFSLYDSCGTTSAEKRQVSALLPKIAELNGVNLQKVQSFMLDKCLPPTTTKSSSNMDETGIGSTLRKSGESELVVFPYCDPEITKAVFVLEHWEPRQASYHLLSILNQENALGSSGSSAKIRAVCCLLRLLSPSEIHAHMSLHLDDMRTKLSELLYGNEMEKANLPYTTKAFREANKESLAKALWRNRFQNRMVLPVVSNLCIDFEVTAWELMEEILKELANSGPEALFREALLYCEKKMVLWKIPTLPTFWTRYYQSMIFKCSKLEEKSGSWILVLCLLFLRCPCYNRSAVQQMVQSFQQLPVSPGDGTASKVCEILSVL